MLTISKRWTRWHHHITEDFGLISASSSRDLRAQVWRYQVLGTHRKKSRKEGSKPAEASITIRAASATYSTHPEIGSTKFKVSRPSLEMDQLCLKWRTDRNGEFQYFRPACFLSQLSHQWVDSVTGELTQSRLSRLYHRQIESTIFKWLRLSRLS